MQDSIREQAVRWIKGLDIIVNIEYTKDGDFESMTVTGVPKNP